jgi:serine/threonine-protein kinase
VTARPDARSDRQPELFPEGLVGGRYRIGRILGVGGTATVFEAVDEQSGEAVAVKAIPRDERLQRRARREIRVAQALDHPAIVRLLATVDDPDYIYVVFELVRGDDLAHAFREGMLDEAGTLRAVAGVCDALAHAHSRGVVHRDVKPGNVLLREDGVLKLTDFGIALVDHPDATMDDRLLGTLSYMAPEQALG